MNEKEKWTFYGICKKEGIKLLYGICVETGRCLSEKTLEETNFGNFKDGEQMKEMLNLCFAAEPERYQVEPDSEDKRYIQIKVY